ncbi:tetratricopeptide repeat protein [Azospirillum thermophilum]|uniref:tetratricopeptide repeat protein n=1 Tax=Azospirillum thermophilum TaxID=2202148 RepID=UPI001FE3A6D3|nr:tetratricopeptide repeat protein [Azospirillum thermophilum]
MVTVEQAVLIALDHHQSGRWAEAEELYRRILEADPLCADALLLLGVLLSQTGRSPQGVAPLRRAVCLRPDGAGVLSNLAGALQTTGDAVAAEQAYRRALCCDPQLADARASRAAALRALGRPGEAARSAALALALAPAHADALVNRADALLAALDGAGAERLARRALVAAGDRPMVRLTLSAALARQQRWAEAEAELRAAVARQPGLGEAWESLGSVLAKQGRAAESLAAFAEAEVRRPGPDLWAARGAALISLARPGDALADFDRALAVRPQDAGLHWNRGFARLLAGDYAGGWPEFDWRRRDDRAEPPWRPFPQPTWRGEEIAGRTILLHAEQGLGDTLQFLRFVPLVAARGARVVLEVQPPLLPLVRGLEGVAQVIGRGDPLPSFDLECPLMSLPLAFGTTLDGVPAAVPYLRPDPARVARWRKRLGRGGRRSVWCGPAIRVSPATACARPGWRGCGRCSACRGYASSGCRWGRDGRIWPGRRFHRASPTWGRRSPTGPTPPPSWPASIW